jgi:excisionase family DNA binding protein
VLVGYSAYVLDHLLRSSVLSDPGEYAFVVRAMTPRQRSAFERALREIHLAAQEWLDLQRAAASGTTATAPTPVRSVSGHDDIGTRDAAELLGLGERRVRDLVAAGELGARRVGNSWRLSRAAVLDYAADRRRRAA